MDNPNVGTEEWCVGDIIVDKKIKIIKYIITNICQNVFTLSPVRNKQMEVVFIRDILKLYFVREEKEDVLW